MGLLCRRALLLVSLAASGLGSCLSSQLSRLLSHFSSGRALPVEVRLVPALALGPVPGDSVQTVFLLDLSARSASDLGTLESVHSFLPRLLARMAAANETLERDKFLYTHDLGEFRRCLVSVARIPSDMHQKLDLARRLAGTLSQEEAVVHVLTEGGEAALDLDMSEALVSALAAARFEMPSWKTSAASSPGRFTLTLVCPESLPDAPEGDVGGRGTTPSSDTSDLERAMAEAASRRFAVGSSRPSEQTTRASVARHLDRWQWVAQGTNMARALAAAPPNVLTPRAYADWVRDLAADLNMCV